MSEIEIKNKAYNAWMRPALGNLEAAMNELLQNFETTYGCSVMCALPSGEDVRFKGKRLDLKPVFTLGAFHLIPPQVLEGFQSDQVQPTS